MISLTASPEEVQRRRLVLESILEHVRNDQSIRLPAFDHQAPAASDFALLSIAGDGNPFSGGVGPYLYQFEGEDDLLHLFVVRRDGGELSVEEAQAVVSFLLWGVSPALIWLKPGSVSQHFYVGHDELIDNLEL